MRKLFEEAELQFITETQRLVPLIDENPEYQALFIHLVDLYEDIASRALVYEQ